MGTCRTEYYWWIISLHVLIKYLWIKSSSHIILVLRVSKSSVSIYYKWTVATLAVLGVPGNMVILSTS